MKPARLIEYVALHPGLSATQIAKELKLESGTISGMLVKLVGQKLLTRKPGLGPRGGYGYFSPTPPKTKTSWQRILADD
jgi:predicted transcriptional regulator